MSPWTKAPERRFGPGSVVETRYAQSVKQIIRHLVTFGFAGCLVAGVALLGQTREELRRKYGEEVSQTFVARPGICVTATYAADGWITELLISPPGHRSHQVAGDDLKPRLCQGDHRRVSAEFRTRQISGRWVRQCEVRSRGRLLGHFRELREGHDLLQCRSKRVGALCRR